MNRDIIIKLVEEAVTSGARQQMACEEIDKQGMIFDLLFLDNSMKKLTGLENAKQIRQSASMSVCSIVFVTSADDHDQFRQVLPLQVVCKPGTKGLWMSFWKGYWSKKDYGALD